MSKHVATIDDAAANQEEADARIEDDTAELEARQKCRRRSRPSYERHGEDENCR